MVRGGPNLYTLRIDQFYSDWIQVSPILDLVNDCFRFVTGFFDLISTSALHIYHSALPLSPQTSIVRVLYEPHARPLAKVIQGVPASWDSSIVDTTFPNTICAAAWSPCNRLVAIAQPSSSEIAILDAVTLDRLYTMCTTGQVHSWKNLVFSPDSRLLTCHWCTAYSANYLVTWDLQTGGLISDISIPRDLWSYHSMSYSGCGTIIGVLFKGSGIPTIITCNILSGMHISSHSVKESVTDTIWTHDKCLRFATMELGSITIWEVGFTSRHVPMEVDSLPTPNHFPFTEFLLLPTLSRLGFICQERVLVWDARHSKMLLNCVNVRNPRDISFSPNGHFVVCSTEGPEFYLWKESPGGYLLHQNLTSSAGPTKQIISPNGESIVTFGGSMVQRWHTTHSLTPLSSVSTQPSQHTLEDFILEFSPARMLAVFAQRWDDMATILDLRSYTPPTIINTGMEVCGLGVGQNTIIVVGYGKIVTWDVQDRPYACASIDYHIPITTFRHSGLRLSASISPTLCHIVVKGTGCLEGDLYIYGVGTEEPLAVARSKGLTLGFNPGLSQSSQSVWCATADGDLDEWEIPEGGGGGRIFPVGMYHNLVGPQGELPWQSSRGYQVTDEGWIINSSGKRLLWLPHHWRSGCMARKWSENLLALLQGELPAPVILVLEV